MNEATRTTLKKFLKDRERILSDLEYDIRIDKQNLERSEAKRHDLLTEIEAYRSDLIG